MITLKINTVTTKDYYSLALIVLYMTLKHKIFIKIYVRIKICFILIIIPLIIPLILPGVGKMRDETAAVAVEEFVELKQKMYSFLIVSIKKQRV